MLLAVGQQRQPITIRCADHKEPRVEDVFLRVVRQRLAIQLDNGAARLLNDSLRPTDDDEPGLYPDG